MVKKHFSTRTRRRKYDYYIVALSDRNSVPTENYRMALTLYHFGESPKTLYGVKDDNDYNVIFSKK